MWYSLPFLKGILREVKLSPYQQVTQMYDEHPEEMPFAHYLEVHLRRGYVYSNPEFFWMAVPVVKAELLDGQHPLEIPMGKPDCWYISALAGDMVKAWNCEPYPLEWIGFERGDADGKRLRFYERVRLRAHTS